MLNIIGHRKIYLTLSALIVGASLFAVIFFGFRQGIDFSGGTLWQLRLPNGTTDISSLEEVFRSELKISDAKLNIDTADQTVFVRIKEINEQDHQAFLKILKDRFVGLEELGFQSIGPVVGAELRQNANMAIVFVLLGISLYIAFSFRKVSRPISSWKYGFVTLITLFHDVIVPAGLMAVLGKFLGIEIDTNFIVALLVVMGFSVHDTIVVFDRVRENLSLARGKIEFEKVVNDSVNQTIARSINTSLTLILVLLALLYFGPGGLTYFVLTLLVGTSIGVYSSIFVASPLLVILGRKQG